MQQFDVFSKLLENLQRNDCDGNHLGKFKLFKIDLGKDVFLSVFRTPFYGCFQTLNSNAFLWMNLSCLVQILQSHQRLQKKSSKSGSFFLLNAPKYLGARHFYSLYAQTLPMFWNVFLSKKKKCVKFNRFLCKDKSSQNFLRSLV